MLLTHAIAIAEARSYIAALDDNARTVRGSVGYDQALIYLDASLGDDLPATIEIRIEDPEVLHRLAVQAVTDLATHGLDPLHIELALAYIADARDTDTTGPSGSGVGPSESS